MRNLFKTLFSFNPSFGCAALCIPLVMTACATPQTNPAELSLSEASGKSVVVVKLMGKHVNYFGVNSLSLVKYSETLADRNPDRPPVLGHYKFIDLKYKLNTGGYSVTEIPPGTYFLAYGSIPKKWAGCFNKDTVRFDVVPNTVTYLGEINLDAFYVEVESAMNAYTGDKLGLLNYNRMTGGASLPGPSNFKTDLAYSPKFENSNAGTHKDVSEFLIKSGAKVDVPVTGAKFERMSFSKGADDCAKVSF